MAPALSCCLSPSGCSNMSICKVLCGFYSTSATWDFRRDTHEFCALLGCYAAYSGNSAATFRDNLSVPSSRMKQSKKGAFLFVCLNSLWLLEPWRRNRRGVPKHWYGTTIILCVTSQQSAECLTAITLLNIIGFCFVHVVSTHRYNCYVLNSRSYYVSCSLDCFYVHGSVHHKSIVINVQRGATMCSLYFILLQDHSTYFGCRPHPSSGVHKTAVTATGTSHMIVQLPHSNVTIIRST